MSQLYSGENPKPKILKEDEQCSTIKGERLYIDISSIKQTSKLENASTGCFVWMN